MQNYLAAVSIALKCGVSKSDILKATKTLKPNKGRLESKAFNNFTLIDDTYNANPESVKSAIEVLRKDKSRSKRILLLGDMFELGTESQKLHKNLVIDLEKIKNLTVYTIGKETKKISENLKKVTEKKHFRTRDQFSKFLSEIDLNDAVILVKGSRGMKMEDFADVIIKRAN
jgi:UDP-N-acetylmuramoyl-tripeptide--D-alanyl-D-alanine ligase